MKQNVIVLQLLLYYVFEGMQVKRVAFLSIPRVSSVLSVLQFLINK